MDMYNVNSIIINLSMLPPASNLSMGLFLPLGREIEAIRTILRRENPTDVTGHIKIYLCICILDNNEADGHDSHAVARRGQRSFVSILIYLWDIDYMK
jgi:hypothetical protein